MDFTIDPDTVAMAEAVLRFARVMRIPDGTGETQRRTIGRQLLTGQADL